MFPPPPTLKPSSPRARFQSREAEGEEKGFYWGPPSSAQALRSPRGDWGCRGAQAGRKLPPPSWVPSPRARRRPNLPTGLIPRPVYHEGSMSGSARQQEARRHQGDFFGGGGGITGHCTPPPPRGRGLNLEGG